MDTTSEFEKRENWRTQKPENAWWQDVDAEKFVKQFSTSVFLIAFAAYLIANLDVLSLVRLVDDFAANAMTEAVSIAVTVLVIERLSKKRAEEERKQALILQMGSRSNDFALEAVRLLEHYGMTKDGSLRGKYFGGAQLQKASLISADLRDAQFMHANLQGAGLYQATLSDANLWQVNLQGADLRQADLQGTTLPLANLQEANLALTKLQGADLWEANLQGADLWHANLQGAGLRQATLSGANLREANLQGADLSGADLMGAILWQVSLPDGTQWTDETDMARFNDPKHPEFWGAAG